MNAEAQSTAMPGARPLKVLLVEDSNVLAERLSELLGHVPGVTLIERVDSEGAAIRSVRSQAIDVLILDLHLRQGTGFGVLRALAQVPRAAVTTIVLTNYALPQYRRTAGELGARYFLDKAREFDRLPDVLREIAVAAG